MPAPPLPAPLRRAARRWRRRPLRVWHHPSFRLAPGGPTLTPMHPRRADDALTWALDHGVLDPDDVATPGEIPWADAALVHDRTYLERLDDPQEVARILASDVGSVPHGAVVELWRRAAGGTLAAARWALAEGHVGAVTMGGFHHAEPARGGGFCALDDVAIAIARLRAEGLTGWVRVIDLDAHPPDGLVACLLDDPRVEILSLSVDSSWRVPDRPHTVDRRVPPGTSDDDYLDALQRLLADAHAPPSLLIYLAGSDPLAGDPLGGLAVSEAGLRTRDRWVFRAHRGLPTVAVPAGGYTEGAWRVLAGTLAEAAGLHTRVEPDYAPLARRTRHVMRHLDPALLSGDDRWDDDELLASLGMARARERRFLDFYSRHGLEYALTRYGLLPALRAMGFDDLEVAFEAGGAGDRLTVTTPWHGERTALVDLTLSRRPHGPFTVLFVEWLEMRDPRAAGHPGRPNLPGQRGPGLGLAPEVGHLLTAAAQRLGLDGVGLVPAHFHVAWMARSDFVFVEPTARGRFDALLDVDLPLADLSRRLEGDGLPTHDGDPVHWAPELMVVPVSEALREALFLDAPEAAAVADALRARLAVPLREARA